MIPSSRLGPLPDSQVALERQLRTGEVHERIQGKNKEVYTESNSSPLHSLVSYRLNGCAGSSAGCSYRAWQVHIALLVRHRDFRALSLTSWSCSSTFYKNIAFWDLSKGTFSFTRHIMNVFLSSLLISSQGFGVTIFMFASEHYLWI